jgi:hypothetical protein
VYRSLETFHLLALTGVAESPGATYPILKKDVKKDIYLHN